MTGIVCESMRKVAIGNVWSGHQVRGDVDDKDAALLESAICTLPIQQLQLLCLCFVRNAPSYIVCRKLKIPQRPASEFVERFRAAQEAIEVIVDNVGNR